MDLYCKMYLDCNLEKDKLFENIKNILDGEAVSFYCIKKKWCEIYLNSNKLPPSWTEYDATDFVNWPYYLDIEPVAIGEEYMMNIKLLMKQLKSLDINVVASCDFEDYLKDDCEKVLESYEDMAEGKRRECQEYFYEMKRKYNNA